MHTRARFLSVLTFCAPTIAALCGCSTDAPASATSGQDPTGGASASGGGGGAAAGGGGSGGSGGSGGMVECLIAGPDGATWNAPDGIDERSIVATAASDGTLWVATHYGLFRSDDKGQSFANVPIDGVGSSVYAEVYAVAAAGDDVYISLQSVSVDAELRVSHDRGASWESIDAGLVTGLGYNPVTLLRTDGATVLARSYQGRGYRWDAPSSSWALLGSAQSSIDTVAIDGSTIYAARPFDGLYWSDDGGASWSSFPDDQTFFGTTALAVHDGLLFRTISNGTCTTQRSADKGETWETLPLDEPTYGCTYDLLSAGGALYASTSTGIARSADDGATWSLVATIGDGPEQLLVQSAALAVDGATIYAGRAEMLASTDGVAWTPTSPVGAANAWTLATAGGAMFATNGDFKTYRSADGGETWSHVKLTADGEPWPGGFISMTDDDPSTTVLFGIVATTFPWQPALAGTGVLFHSGDEGASWTALGGAGLASFGPIQKHGSVVLIGTHDRVAQNGEAPFLLPGGDGLLRSPDGGVSWAEGNAGLPLVPVQGGSVYANVVGMAFAGEGWLVGLADHGVYRSMDDGASWTSVSPGLSPSSPTAFAADGDVVLAGSRSQSGILRSIDGGATWSAASATGLPSGARVQALVATGGYFFVSTVDAGGAPTVSFSHDGGDTWTDLSKGLLAPVESLLVAGGRLFAGTNGRSLQRLDLGPCTRP